VPRPIILGVVGDSAAGKTTISRGLVRVLGEHAVTHACTDDYHRYDRRQRAELGMTPLHPDCNHLDVMAQDLRHLRNGEAFLKPVYRHADGTFAPPVYVEPRGFAIVEGPARLPHPSDARLLRRARLPRAARGPTAQVEGAARLLAARLHDDQVLEELDRREADSEPSSARSSAWRTSSCRSARRPGDRPPRRRAALRDGLAASRPRAVRSANAARHADARAARRAAWIPGDIDPSAPAEIEEAIWNADALSREPPALPSASREFTVRYNNGASTDSQSCIGRWRSCRVLGALPPS
jgi:phosphoribulokinase